MWDSIIGHKKEIEQLRNAAVSKELAHTYLFAGPEGVGKKCVARLFAAAVICKDASPSGDPCGMCTDCTNIAKDIHPDFTIIEPEGDEIRIDKIREVRAGMRFAPLSGKRRFTIINDAHLMNTNAANAALKILEEPAEGNYFILITSVPNRLPPTIISRCRRINFQPLSEGEIKKYLTSCLKRTDDDAAYAARFAEGSIGRAIGINVELISAVTDDLLSVLADPSAARIIKQAEKWKTNEDEIKEVVYIIHRLFHDALDGAVRVRDIGQGSAMEMASAIIRSANGRERLLDKCRAINRAHEWALTAYNKQLMFEQLLFTLTS